MCQLLNIFFNHRILKSPHIGSYYVYNNAGFTALIFDRSDSFMYYILWVSDTSDTGNYMNLVRFLTLKGLSKKHVINFLTTNPKVNEALALHWLRALVYLVLYLPITYLNLPITIGDFVIKLEVVWV